MQNEYGESEETNNVGNENDEDNGVESDGGTDYADEEYVDDGSDWRQG